MEHCAAQEGFNVVDEINQRLLRLYPAAVDVELDDDPTMVDGMSSAHNSVIAWKNRLHNYQAEHDHLAQDEGTPVPSLRSLPFKLAVLLTTLTMVTFSMRMHDRLSCTARSPLSATEPLQTIDQ